MSKSQVKEERPRTTVVKISFEVRDYIKSRTAKSEDGLKLESVDMTLRKLFGRPFKEWLRTQNGRGE